MTDIEKAKNKLKISGYQHPTEVTQNKTERYKTLNTVSKNATYSISRYKSKYATFTEENTPDNELNIKFDLSLCPKCKSKAMYACECELKDRQCLNGHVWYVNNSGQVVVEDPHDDDK